MSNREISDLTSRIQSMQEVFVKKEPVKKPPKRRHTFCSIRKLSAISEERESASTFRNSGFTEELSDVHNSDEFENSLGVEPENFTDAKQDTPVKVLRERIKILGNEYDELLEFTRLEETTKCSVEEDMAQKITMLSMANSDLRSSLEYAEKQIQKLLLENEKAKQSVNDYDYLVESQKKRYEKRVNELLDQINECNSDKTVPVQTPQIDTFEYEEMIDTIASLKKQNEKLQELVDTANSYNANSKYLEDKNKQLLEENRSLELANSESQNKLSFLQSENVKFNHTINALTLQVSQLKIRNQSLLTKYSGLENQNNLLSNNVNTISSLEKQISELKEQTCTLRSDLMQAKSELNESLDKLLEVTQDLDAEERKSSELQKQLQIEKRLRKEAEIKLDRFEHSTHGVRRFSSDSLIDQKCKSLDSSVLHMLRKLRVILTRPHISDTSVDTISMSHESALSNLSEIPLQNERASSDTSLSDSAENYLSVDLEKLKSFSSCHLEDSANDEEFINYCKSMCNEDFIQSGDENVTKTSKSLNEPNKADEALLIEIDLLKSEIYTVKLENQSNKTTIDELQKKLDDYNYSNLSDSEKIEKTENNSCIPNGLESLRMERINNLVLIEKLERDKEIEQLKYKQLQEIHSRTCSELDEKIKEIQVLSKEQDNLSRTIENLNSRLEVQQIRISNQNQLKRQKILEDNDQQINEKLPSMLEVENYQEVIQQLKSEVCILKNTINDLNIDNSEKDDQVLGLRALMRKELENNENLKILFEKEQDISSQARLKLESYQEFIKKLKSEKLDCENSQSEIDILNEANKDLIILNSEKENRLHELYTDFWKNIESSDILNVVFEKEQDNSTEARLEVENYEKRIQQLIEQQQFNNLQSPIGTLKKTNNDLNALNAEKNNQLLELHAELRKKVESTENFKHLLEKEQNNCKQALLQLENNQKLIKQFESEKQQIDNLQTEIDILKKTNIDLNSLYSERDNQLLNLRVELKKNVESKENFKILFEKEQNNYKQARFEIENYEKLIKQFNSEKQQIEDNFQSEVDIMKKINNDLNALNSEKENQLLELRAELKKFVESKENFKVLFEKEQNNYKQARLEIENHEKVIKQLNSEKQQIDDNFQSELDIMKKINNDLNALNSEKENQLFELRAELNKSVESKENFKVLFEKEQNNYKQARLEIENYEKLIKQLNSEKQQIDDNFQSELDIMKKINNDLNALNSEKENQLVELRAELKKSVESKENFKVLFEKEQNNYKQARLEIENYEKLIKQLNSEKQQIDDNFQPEVDIMKKINNDLNALNSEKENQLLELRAELKKFVESKENFKVLFEKEQNNYKQARLEIENYEKVIKQLNSEKQQIDDNFQSELDIMKKINNDLNALNSEKENQLLELRAELNESVESKENFKVLFEKEQNNYKQARLEIENYEKLIKQLNLEKQQIDDNFQSELDIMKKINNDLNALNSEKENQLVELRAELKKSVESKENFKVLFEKEQNNYKQARLEIENYEKLIKQLNLEKQQIDDNFQSELDIMKKINNDLNDLNSEKENQLVELRAELKKSVESKENFKVLFEKEQNNYKQARLEIENYEKLIKQLDSEKQQIEDNFQSKVDIMKKINNDLNALNSEKENQLVELRAELKEIVKSKENYKMLFEKERDDCGQIKLKVENCHKLILRLKSEKRECSILQSEIDNLKKINDDLNNLNSEKDRQLRELRVEKRENIDNKENFRVLFENERENCKRAKREVENCHNLIQTLNTEKKLLETLKDTNCKLLSQVDCLNLKNRDLIAEIEVKNHQIVTLNSERDRSLKSIEDFQKEQIKLKLEKDTLLQRLNNLEKNNVGVADSTRNNQESIINKVYSEFSKLKEILPKDESKNSHLREMLLYNRKCWNDNSKLHDIKLLIDKVNALVEERNLLKHQNDVGYEQLKQVHEIMKREVEAEKRHNNLLITKLENECRKLRDKNDTYKSEVEELRTSLTIMQTKQLNYRKQTENLSFENQNLVEKVKEMKNLQLNYKKIEQNLQYLVNENKTLTAKLCTKNKDIMNYETNQGKLEDIETENRKLTFKINQSENRQLIECNAFPVEGRSKAINPGVLVNSNQNDEFVERKVFEILKTKFEQLKKIHQSCNQQDSEIEYMIMCRKENKWKQQRTETHDSRRSIDLKTLCSESVVDTCNSCEDMSNQLQKTKSEISQLRKYIDSMSTSEFEVLKGKYETLKKLCRMRNDEISNLKQSLSQKK
ncbi:hypothetical protein WA026_010506 [Henosepilachna vigintioctopunctata]